MHPYKGTILSYDERMSTVQPLISKPTPLLPPPPAQYDTIELTRTAKIQIEYGWKVYWSITITVFAITAIIFNQAVAVLMLKYLGMDPGTNFIPVGVGLVICVLVYYFGAIIVEWTAMSTHINERQQQHGAGGYVEPDMHRLRKATRDFAGEVRRKHGVTDVYGIPVPFLSSSIVGGPPAVGHPLMTPIFVTHHPPHHHR
jgi:hypothetical protein